MNFAFPLSHEPVHKMPAAEFNYVTLALSYVKHALAPAVTAWQGWSAHQRMIAVALSSPLLLFPGIPLLLALPWLIAIAALCYVAMFGWQTASAHATEAWNEHYDDRLMQKLRGNLQRQNQLVASVLQYSADLVSPAVNYSIGMLVVAIDMCISTMTGVSTTLKSVQKRASEDSPHGKPVRKSYAKPVISLESSPSK